MFSDFTSPYKRLNKRWFASMFAVYVVKVFKPPQLFIMNLTFQLIKRVFRLKGQGYSVVIFAKNVSVLYIQFCGLN